MSLQSAFTAVQYSAAVFHHVAMANQDFDSDCLFSVCVRYEPREADDRWVLAALPFKLLTGILIRRQSCSC